MNELIQFREVLYSLVCRIPFQPAPGCSECQYSQQDCFGHRPGVVETGRRPLATPAALDPFRRLIPATLTRSLGGIWPIPDHVARHESKTEDRG